MSEAERNRMVRATKVERAIWEAFRQIGETEISVLICGLVSVTKRIADHGIRDEAERPASAPSDRSPA